MCPAPTESALSVAINSCSEARGLCESDSHLQQTKYRAPNAAHSQSPSASESLHSSPPHPGPDCLSSSAVLDSPCPPPAAHSVPLPPFAVPSNAVFAPDSLTVNQKGYNNGEFQCVHVLYPLTGLHPAPVPETAPIQLA